MKNKSLLAAVGFAALVVVVYVFMFRTSGPNENNVSKQNDKLQVVTSFYPLYFFTSEIVGGYADVYNITPAGAEPHDYDPTTRDMTRLEGSGLIIVNGADFEPWVKDIQQIFKNTDTVIAITGASLIRKNKIAEDESVRDPHVWLNPLLAKKQVEIILENLIKVDPTHAEIYKTNAKTLVDKLENLNQEFVQNLDSCQKKDIITSHSAFSYLAEAYGFNQISVAGLSPDEEPSAEQLVSVADFARKHDLKYIFFETLVSPKFSETIAKEIGAKTLVLNPLEGLADEEIAEGKNYFTEMRNNLANLKIALECL